jgi:hypothetical protein
MHASLAISGSEPWAPDDHLQPCNTLSSGLLRTSTINSGCTHFFFFSTLCLLTYYQTYFTPFTNHHNIYTIERRSQPSCRGKSQGSKPNDRNRVSFTKETFSEEIILTKGFCVEKTGCLGFGN